MWQFWFFFLTWVHNNKYYLGSWLAKQSHKYKLAAEAADDCIQVRIYSKENKQTSLAEQLFPHVPSSQSVPKDWNTF